MAPTEGRPVRICWPRHPRALTPLEIKRLRLIERWRAFRISGGPSLPPRSMAKLEREGLIEPFSYHHSGWTLTTRGRDLVRWLQLQSGTAAGRRDPWRDEGDTADGEGTA